MRSIEPFEISVLCVRPVERVVVLCVEELYTLGGIGLTQRGDAVIAGEKCNIPGTMGHEVGRCLLWRAMLGVHVCVLREAIEAARRSEKSRSRPPLYFAFERESPKLVPFIFTKRLPSAI